jgi:hypothetical protein
MCKLPYEYIACFSDQLVSAVVSECMRGLELLYIAFGNSLCSYKRCWKRCPRVSIQAWTCLILFANPFCRSAFRKSLCTCKRCWKWCPQASILTTKSTYHSTATFPQVPVHRPGCSYFHWQLSCVLTETCKKAWISYYMFGCFILFPWQE